MANQEDVRQIALSLPGTSESDDHFAFSVLNRGKPKGILWAWNERVHPKKPRVPRRDIIAVRVASETVKQALLSTDSEKFFTEPHYDGFPAILVRLAAVRKPELRELIAEAWRCQAPRELVVQVDPKPESAPKKRAARRPSR
jgi:hypothetical protein